MIQVWMETHEGKSKDLRKTKFQNCNAKQCLLRPHPLKFLPHNSAKGDKPSWYWHPTAVRGKTSTKTHRIDGKGGISSTLRSSYELKTDLDYKLLKMDPSKSWGCCQFLSSFSINFCCVLNRITKKCIYWKLGCTTCTHTFRLWCRI